MSFATNLTGLTDIKIFPAAAIAMILKCILDDCKIWDIELHATLELQKQCNKYLQYLRFRITCIGTNSYNISYYNAEESIGRSGSALSNSSKA
jgi:hypothetical protein